MGTGEAKGWSSPSKTSRRLALRPEEFQKMRELEERHWWYRSRTRLVEGALSRICDDGRGLKILDLATACGRNLEHFGGRGQVYGIDISMESLRYCRERGGAGIVLADAMRIPFKDGTFDLVLALDALEHFEDDGRALEEVRRVLKGEGRLIATVPALMLLWSAHDEAYQHWRRYTKAGLAGKLEAANLAVERITYWTTLLMPPVYLFRRLRGLWEGGEPRSDFHTALPSIVDRLLGGIQALERALIAWGISLPFGVSLFCVARK